MTDGVLESDDLLDLRERLSAMITTPSRTVLPVFGSGASLSALPSTRDFADKFAEALSDGARQRLEQRTAHSTDAERYQQAAALLSRTQGDEVLSKLVRREILAACTDASGNETTTEVEDLVAHGSWRVPSVYREFANFYSRFPPELRLPIVTTNFDPLIEVALRDAGLGHSPRSIVYDNPPTERDLADPSNVVVLHIHGYFTDYGLHSVDHITSGRPNVADMFRRLFERSTLLVVGYSGWDDVLMQTLEQHQVARQFTRDPLATEVIWCGYPPKRVTLQNPRLSRLDASPGFTLFNEIDAAGIFSSVGATRIGGSPSIPNGWLALPQSTATINPPAVFSDGGVPTWSDAIQGQWPVLTATDRLLAAVKASIQDHTLGVAAVGPVGEGKSLGLRQVATALAADAALTVLWRQAGATPLTEDFLESPERAALGTIVFCIDDADLATLDLQALALPRSTPHHLLIACHDRLYWTLPRQVAHSLETVAYDGFTSADAAALAKRWLQLGLITERRTDGSRREIASELVAASHSNTHGSSSTLLGAILEVRDPEGLDLRIHDLLDRLYRLPLSNGKKPVTMGHIFGAICLLELFPQRAGFAAGGASRQLITKLATLDGEYAEKAILLALGREASLTFAANYVYSRHKQIARSVVRWLRSSSRLHEVVLQVSRAGGALRVEAGAARDEYEDAYKIALRLEDTALAEAAAAAAADSARSLLEPRITYISLRRKTHVPAAKSYAEQLVSHIDSFTDRRTAARVFLTELAQIDLADNLHRRAAGLCALAMHDHTGIEINARELSYCLGTLARCYHRLVLQNRQEFQRGGQLLRRASELLLPQDGFQRYVEPQLRELPAADFARTAIHPLLIRLAGELTPLARHSGTEWALTRDHDPAAKVVRFAGQLSFSGLSTYARAH